MTPEQIKEAMQDFKKRADALKEWFEAMNKIFDGKSFLFAIVVGAVVISCLYYATRHVDRLADRYNSYEHKEHKVAKKGR